MNSKLDIIVPVYNDQDGLNKLLSSIERQTISSEVVRILIVDNGSQPSIKLPTTRFESHLLNCDKQGSYAARNKALALVKSEIVAFTDADCILDSNWAVNGLYAINKKIKGSNTPVILAGDISIISSNKPANSADLADIYFGMTQKKFVSRGHYGITANLWVSREDLFSLNGFDENLKSGGDRDFCIRARQQLNAKVIYSPNCIVHHPARTKQQLIIKSKRLLGGQFDRAKGNTFREVIALLLHMRPIIKETTESLMLRVSLKRRIKLIYFLWIVRTSSIPEWFRLFAGLKNSSRL